MLRYAITDRMGFAGDQAARQEALVRQAAGWAAAGVDYVQLREKDLEGAALAVLARRMLAALREGSGTTRLLINSRADIALAVGADGVHLTSTPGVRTPAEVRRAYAGAGLPEPVVSVSCHTLEEVVRAPDSTASLILFGPIFEKVVLQRSAFGQAAPQPMDTLVSEGIGLNLLHLACAAAARTPVLALGGINRENTQACLDAGAAGIAGIRLFLE